MKTKLTVFLFAIVICVLSFSSCKLFSLGGDPDGFIYDKDSELVIVYADDGLPADVKNSIYNALTEARGTAPDFGSASLSRAKHEIIIGRSDREASVAAYARLEQLDDEFGQNQRYVIYSDGASVAIAYDEDNGYVTASRVVALFIEKYVKETLTLAKGAAVAETEPLLELWEARDLVLQEQAWQKMADYIGGEKGQAVVDAFKVLYTNYDEGVVEWIANMYAPRECVCENYDANGDKVCLHPVDAEGNYLCSGGGFYYSVSALENEGFLPDIESTEQALSMIQASGMAASVGGKYVNAIPSWMKNEIIAFIQPMQDSESGYFYHPQWGSDVGTSRRSRDVNNAASVLLALGSRPLYDTPAGVEGSDDVEPMSYGFATGRLGASAVTAVSKVLSTSSIVESSPWLESDVTFRAYLNGEYGNDMDLATNSYQIGNTMTAQTKIIKQRDKELAAEGADYRLMDILIEWFDKGQSSETGHWHTETNYYAMNGVLKILGVYASAGRAVNYAEQLAESIIEIIVCDEEPDGVVRIYNAWGSMAKLVSNINEYAPAIDPVTGMTPKERLAALMDKMYEIAPEGIRITSERIAMFRKSDGGFSYKIDFSSPTSQGVPAAVPNSPESDMNATMLATSGLVNHILSSLRLSSKRVPIYGEADRLRFLEIVNSASPIMKLPIKLSTPSPKTFDDETLGEKPTTGLSNITMQSVKGEIFVADDPRENVEGNVVYFNSPNDKVELGGKGKPDYFYIRSASGGSASNCFVVESDMCFIADKTAEGKVARMNMDDAYCIFFNVVGDNVHVWECSNTSDSSSRNVELAIIPLDEWFNIKIEYYAGDEDTVRIKVYLNGSLLAVSDNYYDKDKTKITTGHGTPARAYTRTKFEAISSATVGVYFDNVNSYKESKNYEASRDASLALNVDAPDKEEVVYDFATDAGDLVLNGDTEVKGGKLNVYSGYEAAGFTAPINLKNAKGNAVTLAMDLLVSANTVGEIAKIRLVEDNSVGGASLEIILKVKDNGGNKVVVIEMKSSAETLELEDVEIQIDKITSLSLVYFREEAVTLVYVDGERLVSTPLTYSAAPRYTVGKLIFTNSTQNTANIGIDNLIFERANVDFAKATEASRPSNKHDFESGTDDGVYTDGSVEGEGDSYLKLDDGESITVPLNQRDAYAPAVIFEAAMLIAYGADGVTHRITMTSESGAAMLSLDLKLIGDVITLHERLGDRTLTAVLGETKMGEEFVLRIEYFTSYGLYHLYINGTLVAVSDSITNAPDGALPTEILIEALLVSEIQMDDVIFEAWDKLYENKKPSVTNAESDAAELTFEYSTLGSIPTSVTTSLRSLGADVRVCQMLDRNGEYTTALKYQSKPGGIDSLLFKLTEKSDTVAITVFEADMMIPSGYDAGSLYQIYFENGEDNNAYMLQMGKVKGGTDITLKDTSDDSSNTADRVVGDEHVIGSAGTWINLRVELHHGDANTVKFKIYVDNTLLFESDNYYGSHKGGAPYNNVTAVRFNAMKDRNTLIYFDNVSMKQLSSAK